MELNFLYNITIWINVEFVREEYCKRIDIQIVCKNMLKLWFYTSFVTPPKNLFVFIYTDACEGFLDLYADT